MIDIRSLFYDCDVIYNDDSNNSSPGFVQTKCVFCDDPSDHLGWKINGVYTNCWKCGWHSTTDALMLLLCLPFEDVKKLTTQYSGRISLLKKMKKSKVKKVDALVMPGESLGVSHKRYLRKRNFDPDRIEKKYQIKGTGVTGDWKFRIMIPIFYGSELVNYQGRDTTDKQKLRYKLLSSEECIVDREKMLYNIDNCPGKSIIVVEGILDVWRMGNNCAATFGSSVTEYQVKILTRYKNIFFIFDSETEAQDKARKTAEKLASLDRHVEIIDLDNGGDPAELSEEEVQNIRKDVFV